MPTHTRRATTARATIPTRLGTLPLLGRNRWGLAMVKCPNCGGTASVDSAGDVWCWECNYTSSGQFACT